MSPRLKLKLKLRDTERLCCLTNININFGFNFNSNFNCGLLVYFLHLSELFYYVLAQSGGDLVLVLALSWAALLVAAPKDEQGKKSGRSG